MTKRFLIFVIAGILIASSIAFVSATGASYINYQSQADFQTYYSREDLTNYWPILNEKDGECRGRQDILLTVSPAGCQPAVVRSDLLADQNVPVFCQIDALQINPLLNIKQIRNIRFSGASSKDVVGTGFHPARAAVATRDILLGSPLINNVGYVVVVLKRNPIEKDLPDFITLNLSAQIEYDAGNALGVGRAQFSLSPVKDEDWVTERNKQSFWNGRYFLRLNDADENSASLSVYDGDRSISTMTVKRGETSREIFMPGSFCMAALQIVYDGLEVAKDKAIIRVTDDAGTDTIDAYSGSLFNNDRCRVDKVTVDKDNPEFGNVSINCGGGVFGGGNKFILERKALKEGGLLQDKSLIPSIKAPFDEAISVYEKVADDYPSEKIREAENPTGYSNYGEAALDKAIILARDYGQFTTEERLLNKIIDLYPSSAKINEYKQMQNELHSMDTSGATKVLNVNGKYVTVQLINFKTPVKKPSVLLSSSSKGGGVEINLKEGEIAQSFGDFKSLRVNKISIDSKGPLVEVTAMCKESKASSTLGVTTIAHGETGALRIGEEKKICDLYLKLEDSDIEKVAKVRLIPRAAYSASETNLTVKIGIDKRAIQLSPEKTKDLIKNLNESIERWDKISQRLGTVVKTMKAACFATSLALTVKNFVSGVDGTALARQQAMSGDNGWKKRCQNAINTGRIDRNGDGTSDADVSYKTMTECFSKGSDSINKEIGDRVNAIQNVNGRVSGVESKEGISKSSLVGGTSVDTNKAVVEYYKVLEQKYGAETLRSYNINPPAADGTAPYTYQDLRDLDYNLELKNYGFANSAAKAIGDKVKATTTAIDAANRNKQEWGSEATVVGSGAALQQPARGRILSVSGGAIGSMKVTGGVLPEGADGAMRVHGVKKLTSGTTEGADYLVVGKRSGNQLQPLEVFEYTETTGQVNLEENIYGKDIRRFTGDYQISSFEDSGSALQGNMIKDAESRKVIFFATGPDKGLAYRVPFDSNNGWYARVESSLNVANQIPAYDSSGMPRSWRICNVGSDGSVSANDDCQLYIEGSGVTKILGLPESKSQDLITKSRQALREANNQADKKLIRIGNNDFVRGDPTSVFAGTECQEFMDVQDCNLLFNVCDPVICPATRCNLGGSYPVADVIRTGVIGGAVLCLPNFGNPKEGGVLVPVCLSGIQAGIDAWVTILKSYRDCLQENLDTGQMNGLCDQFYSFSLCDLFWKNVGPFANAVIPKLIEAAYGGGQGARGGAEYLSVQTAWNNVQGSVDYMTQSYASNSFKLFQAKNVEEVGGEFCKMYASAKGPTALKSLMEIESPPQFHASFTAEKYSDATVPASSQYKVLYHIFAGNNYGVYYSVYLKNPPDSPYYATSQTVLVASGFIKKGEYATQTKDFTAPEGYKELCVRINNEEQCGFKQVTTDYGLDYLKNQYVSSQAATTQITSETGCISGSPSLGAAGANLNPQALVEEAVFPQNYERGITRICSTRNPAASTDPTRYVDVGYCEDQNTRCWMDKNSVGNAISDRGIQNQTLSSLEQQQKTALEASGVVLTDDRAVALLQELNDANKKIPQMVAPNNPNVLDLLLRINSAEPLLFYNHHKANLMLVKGEVKEKVARFSLPAPTPTSPTAIVPKAATTAAGEGACASFSGVCTIAECTGEDNLGQQDCDSGKTCCLSSSLANDCERQGGVCASQCSVDVENYGPQDCSEGLQCCEKLPSVAAAGEATPAETKPALWLESAYNPRNTAIIQDENGATKIYIQGTTLYYQGEAESVRIGTIDSENNYKIILLESSKDLIGISYYEYLNDANIDGANIVSSGMGAEGGITEEAPLVLTNTVGPAAKAKLDLAAIAHNKGNWAEAVQLYKEAAPDLEYVNNYVKAAQTYALAAEDALKMSAPILASGFYDSAARDFSIAATAAANAGDSSNAASYRTSAGFYSQKEREAYSQVWEAPELYKTSNAPSLATIKQKSAGQIVIIRPSNEWSFILVPGENPKVFSTDTLIMFKKVVGSTTSNQPGEWAPIKELDLKVGIAAELQATSILYDPDLLAKFQDSRWAFVR